jgi:hypothetical protein
MGHRRVSKLSLETRENRVFNLLVKYGAWGDGRDSMPTGRIFEYTAQALIDRFNPKGQLNFDALIQFPCLFVEETVGEGNQVARVGTIFRTRQNGRDVVIDYTYDTGVPGVPQATLKKLAQYFEIADFEFSRTHWAIKDSDLYRELIKNSQPRRQLPKVFQLAEFENIEPKLMSAMMPFQSKFDPVFETLRQTAEAAGLRCRRADDIWENPAVIQDVVSLIDRSKVVVCDCTERNPNVFYEIGIAHTLGRDVILITQSDSDIPFDLRHLRYVKYLNNSEGLAKLRAILEPRLAETIVD